MSKVTHETRKPLSVVPTGDAYANLKDDFFRWQVVPTSFGGLLQGAKVGAIHMQPGTPIDYHVEHGNLIPLSVDESAEAAVTEFPVTPSYPTVDLQPAKPQLPERPVSTMAEAIKADDAKLAEVAKQVAAKKALEEAEARAKADAELKAKNEAIAKAKAEMTGNATTVIEIKK